MIRLLMGIIKFVLWVFVGFWYNLLFKKNKYQEAKRTQEHALLGLYFVVSEFCCNDLQPDFSPTDMAILTTGGKCCDK